MTIQENIPLAQYTTFKIGGLARYFCVVTNETELIEAVKFAKSKKLHVFILGGGSNLLISDEGFRGLVIKIENRGISYVNNMVTAFAGEIWDEFVANTVSRGFGGLENLSAIPGTVGATAVQNIGAYGSDVSSVIESVRVFDTSNLEFVVFSNSDCGFDYRDSIFKHQKGRFIVVSVTFKLEKNKKVDIGYKDLAEYFSKKGFGVDSSDVGNSGADEKIPSILEVRNAVIEIRGNKLPDWKMWGTAGSFFKNPIIKTKQYDDLKKKFPDLPGFVEPNGMIKIPLGWILDKICNFKGQFFGHVGVYEKQALVIVTRPGASSTEVVELTKKMQDKVKEKTGLIIEAEVEWVN
ncbi:MAG: UDP-N-acetylmuramate dehydrogenase [Candidatus Paceibacterota bacterium]|jgi:UDP-N-acetylmuramate dehydrogenase